MKNYILAISMALICLSIHSPTASASKAGELSQNALGPALLYQDDGSGPHQEELWGGVIGSQMCFLFYNHNLGICKNAPHPYKKQCRDAAKAAFDACLAALAKPDSADPSGASPVQVLLGGNQLIK